MNNSSKTGGGIRSKMIQMTPDEYIKRFGNAYADTQYEAAGGANQYSDSNPYASQFVVTGLPQQNQVPAYRPAQQGVSPYYITPQLVLMVLLAIVVIVAIVAIVIIVRDKK